MYEVSQFLDIPKSGIFSLSNAQSGMVYIGYSSNLLPHVVNIIEELRVGGFRVPQMNEDKHLLKFSVLETGDDIETLKLHVKYWENWYKADGWTMYEPAKRKYLEYKVVIDVSLDEEACDVVLINTRRDRKIVGRFENISEATGFIIDYYNSDINPYNYPIYAANALTKACIMNQIRGIVG